MTHSYEASRRPIGRLAPSPTGAQHVGNARTYLLAWLSIRARGGRIILRIEDIDSPRVKSWAIDQAMDDLKWLGLDWDEGPDIGGRSAPYIQTLRLDSYRDALEKLKTFERIYPCTCSRSDVAAAASAPHLGQEGPLYPGTCSGRRSGDAATLHRPYSWRFRTSDRTLTVDDRLLGVRRCNLARELGDFVVAKQDETAAYQLAVVVDDHTMGVTEVLRGDDLLPSAFRQSELYDVLGWQPPQFCHVPLVVGPDGRRLAKRHGDTRLCEIRGTGAGPERLLGLLAWSCGLRDNGAPVTARELLDDFDVTRVPQEPFVFTSVMWNQLL